MVKNDAAFYADDRDRKAARRQDDNIAHHAGRAWGMPGKPACLNYFEEATSRSTAALTSASLNAALPPRAGIAFLPLMALT